MAFIKTICMFIPNNTFHAHPDYTTITEEVKVIPVMPATTINLILNFHT